MATLPTFEIGTYVRHERDPQERAWQVDEYWTRDGEFTYILVDQGGNDVEAWEWELTPCHNTEGK